MNITHHKNGEIKTLVEEAPYHPGYEDAGFEPKEMNNELVAWIAYDEFGDFMLETTPEGDYPWQPLYTHPAKTLTDEEWNKAFDCYCETDEGVLKFNLELRDEWKKEQLIRWKEALRKAQEK